MNEPDNFGLELASRIALHEALLENLYTNLLRKMPDGQHRWESFSRQLEETMASLQPGQDPQTEEEKQWLHQHRAYSQQLARQFTEKVAGNVMWQNAEAENRKGPLQ